MVESARVGCGVTITILTEQPSRYARSITNGFTIPSHCHHMHRHCHKPSLLHPCLCLCLCLCRITKGVNEALALMRKSFPAMRVMALSGNMCTDKKPSAG